MAKKPTLNTIASGYASNTTLNSNFEELRDAFDNTLSLDGSTPNAMGADLDLNGNNIIGASGLTVNGTDYLAEVTAAKAAALVAQAAAETAETNAETAETNAGSSQTAAASSASAASSSATASAASAVDSTNNGAAQVALAAAQVALAGTARTGAETAETNAETAAALSTTNGAAQVVLATAQVALASTEATNAATSATTATTQASTATTQAGIATTKASEASASASAAAASAASITDEEANAAASAAASAGSATASANSAAASAAALDTFDDRYLGSKTANPTLDNDGDALVAGALYFNSTANEMRVYDGANWIAASSSGVASMNLYEYTATSGQTTFTGADDNGNSISFIAGNEIVVLNGVILDPSDYNSSSGTSIVLASGAATGDLLNVYAFKSFTVADTVSASTGGTFGGNIDVTGTVSADSLTVDGSAAFNLGAGEEVSIYRSTDYAVLRLGASSTDHWSFQEAGTNSLYLGSIDSGTAVNHIKLDNNGDVSFNNTAGSVAKFFWDASAERLGLGTVAPSSPLDINAADGVADNAFALRVQNLEATDDRSYGVYIQAGSTSVDSALAISDHTGANSLLWVAGNGNVGIGTDSPDNNADFKALTIQSTSGSGGGQVYVKSSTATGVLGADNAGSGPKVILQTNTAHPLVFGTNNTERMRLTSGGYLPFGASNTLLPTNGTAGVTLTPEGNVHCGVVGTVGADVMRFDNANGRVGAITVANSATSYNSASDYRLKTDAQPMTGASARVQALNPVNFEWIADGSRVDGFLAHEAATVVPESVTGTKDAMRDEEYEVTPAVLDDDGNETTAAVMGTRSVPDYQGIDQSKLVPLLTAALQEALTEITDLKARVIALEAV